MGAARGITLPLCAGVFDGQERGQGTSRVSRVIAVPGSVIH